MLEKSMSSTDYVGLGPCVQDPAWVKMNSQTLQKRKKKQEAKPQSHINKCLNEKRRREQENTYFEQLAELIQASFVADMNSLSSKPDKCVILQQTVDKINQIKEAEAKANKEAVQQGEVTSSRQTLLQNKLVCPLVLQALDGFLFLVSTEDKIELVSENVYQYIKFTPEDLVGKVIYNIIHVGDHEKFSSSFMSVGWPKKSASESSRSRSFTCRLLVKPPDDQEETMEEKQQRVSRYEQMQICAVLHSNYPGERNEPEESSESVSDQQYLLCIARRIPANEPQSNSIEQFTTKLDTRATILDIDISGVSSAYSRYLTKDLVKRNFGDLCYPSDHGNFAALLKDTNISGHSTSKPYKLKFGSSCIHIQSKFKLFQRPQEDSFIMATHTIISTFQDGGSCSSGGTSANSLLEDTLGNALSLVSEDTSDASVESKLAMMLPSQANDATADIHRNMDEMTALDTQSQAQQQNKILKRLLDQKDEDEASLPSPINHFGRGLAKLQKSPSPHHQVNHVNHFMETNSSSSTSNNMLRDLLNDNPNDGADIKIKKERDDLLFEILNESKDDKFTIKQEFRSSATSASPVSNNYFMRRSPSTPPSGPAGMLPSMSSSASSFSFPTASPVAFSRPASVELSNDSEMSSIKGVKRPNEGPHDGNPNKQAARTVGSFESLLAPSPPTSNKSPMSMGGPSTPLASPNTPSSRSNTPIGKSCAGMGGPMNSQMRPSTPYGMTHQSMNMGGHMQEDTINQHMSQNHMNMQNASQYPGMHKPPQLSQTEDGSSKNKLLRELLSNQPSKQGLPPLNEMPSPYALPSEKLPKDIGEKLPRVTSNMSSISYTPTTTHTHTSDILTNLLKQPGTGRTSVKANAGASGAFQQTSQQGAHFFQQQQQAPLHAGMQRQNSQNNINMTSHGGNSMETVDSMLATSDSSRMPMSSTYASSSNTTTTTLPPFVPPSGITPLNVVPSANFADGHLPSITSATSVFTQEPWGADLHDSAIQAILDMEFFSNSQSASGSNDSGLGAILGDYQATMSNTPYENDEKHAIQQIKDRLMSELDIQNAPNVTSSMGFTATQTLSNMNSYPPPYGQRRFPNQGPAGSVNKAMVAQHLPIRNVPQGHQQRMSQLSAQEHIRSRIRHQNQVLLPTSSSDVTQQSPSGFNQSFDDLMSSPSPNVNMVQRNTGDAQSSSNYNLMHSPIGNAGPDQVSPGQRIPQASFSPHGQIPSPLSNSQQFQNSSSLGQMGGYPNAQNSQHSPRLSQGSPDPPNYSSGGNMMPQISPTGQVSPSQQNSGWSPANQQRTALQQNSMLPSQMNVNNRMMAGNNQRGYANASRSGSMLPSMRSLPSAGGRQPNYPPGAQHNTQGESFAGSSPQNSQQIIYSQQQTQQPPYRLQRTISTPVMQANQGHAGMLNSQRRQHMMSRVNTNNCGPDGNGPSSPSLVQQQQIHQRVTQQPQTRQQQQQQQPNANPNNYPTLEHSHSLDQSLLQSMSTNEGNSWGREPASAPSQNHTGPMAPSPRMDDGRTSSSATENDRSLLKKLLISTSNNPPLM